MRNIYADNAATTAIAPAVLDKMMPYLTKVYGIRRAFTEQAVWQRRLLKTHVPTLPKIWGLSTPMKSTSHQAEASLITGL